MDEQKEQGESLEVGEVQAGEPEIVFIDSRSKFSDASKLQVERMVDLMKLGSDIKEAASQTGVDLEAVNHDTKARKQLKELLKDYKLTNNEIKALVSGQAVKLALEAGEDKDRLAALKLLANIPGVDMAGSKTQVNVGVGVFSEETNAVLDAIDLNG